jgi:DNA-binding NarL/FixJ family response regulator
MNNDGQPPAALEEKSIRVLLADDNPPTREGIRAVLEGAGIAVCAEAGNAAAAVEAARRERPDVCLLDVHMPGSGISAAATISSELSETAVVMLTAADNDDELFDALVAGAAGYLLKDTAPARLPSAVRGVTEGEAALSRKLTARVIDEFRGRVQRRRLPLAHRQGVDLTSREWEVLELMRHKLSTAEIAERLFVSPVTVRTHVASVLRKLNVPDRKAAIQLLEER